MFTHILHMCLCVIIISLHSAVTISKHGYFVLNNWCPLSTRNSTILLCRNGC